MILLLNRKWYSKKSVIGELFVDFEWECYTLEDPEREQKIYGITSIPRGEYKIFLDYSSRFKEIMPHLLDVPNFTGIRIHPGNTAENTDGCILVGTDRGKDFIYKSRLAYDKLFQKLMVADADNEDIRIFIQQDAEPEYL